MERIVNLGEFDPHSCTSDSLAFIGDAVYSLMVREYLGSACRFRARELHDKSVEMVCCASQAKAADRLLPYLNEEEAGVYRRGRNFNSSHCSKSASAQEYHSATGLECLFGYIYLKGDIERLRTLFMIVCAE